MFGDGARHGFDWVFEGESTVAVASLDDILDWLAGCQYETDATLFREADYWQHPHTFEQFRRGDCEDFALWTWRKLVELDIDADLVIGRRVPPAPRTAGTRGSCFATGTKSFSSSPSSAIVVKRFGISPPCGPNISRSSASPAIRAGSCSPATPTFSRTPSRGGSWRRPGTREPSRRCLTTATVGVAQDLPVVPDV
jgi:hypothetical protein